MTRNPSFFVRCWSCFSRGEKVVVVVDFACRQQPRHSTTCRSTPEHGTPKRKLLERRPVVVVACMPREIFAQSTSLESRIYPCLHSFLFACMLFAPVLVMVGLGCGCKAMLDRHRTVGGVLPVSWGEESGVASGSRTSKWVLTGVSA